MRPMIVGSNAVIPSERTARVERPPRLPWIAMALLGISLAAITLAAPAQDSGIESNLPGAGFGPSDPAPESATPTIHVYSRETVIDVLATDDKGQPVTGLTRDDFTILEDNHPQPIRSFREYTVSGTLAPPPTLPPNTYTNAQALPATGPVQIFYFQMPVPQGRDIDLGYGAIMVRAKQYIADYLRTMPAGTQVAIFAYLPDMGLRLVQPFTTDGPKAAAAMDSLVVQRLARRGGADRIAAADQIAAYVAGIHGRKNLIWIGPPLMILRDGGSAWGNLDMTRVHRLMDTYDLYTREEIAIDPVDPSGLNFNLLATEVAEQTGGTTSGPTSDYKGEIAKIVDQSSHFYTISYVPTRPDADGHFHPISIEVHRPGVHLTYRTGYNDEQPKPPDPVLAAHMIQGPMRLGALPTSQLLFDLEVQPTPASNLVEYAAAEAKIKAASDAHNKVPEKSFKGSPYDVVFRFDPTQIAFTERLDGRRTASLEFDLGAYDLYGNLVGVRSQAIQVVLGAAQYDQFMQTTCRFYLPIPLPRGRLTLRAGLFDTVAGKSGTLEISLDVPKK